MTVSYIEVESLRLINGQHSWQVQTYWVSRGSWTAMRAGISAWNTEKCKLQLELQDEADEEKRQSIQLRIGLLEKRIAESRYKLDAIQKPLGNLVELRFEVL